EGKIDQIEGVSFPFNLGNQVEDVLIDALIWRTSLRAEFGETVAKRVEFGLVLNFSRRAMFALYDCDVIVVVSIKKVDRPVILAIRDERLQLVEFVRYSPGQEGISKIEKIAEG